MPGVWWFHVKSFAFTLLFTSVTAPCWADLSAGIQAYERRDYGTALKELRPLAHQGEPSAQLMLAYLYAHGEGVAQDQARALRWFLLAAEQDNVLAQLNLGMMLDEGSGVPQDYREAARWFRQAAAHGKATAQVKLGLMYSKGHGVMQDYAKAAPWFRKPPSREMPLRRLI